jgi:cyclic pyranopterin phosphate synthase
MPLDSDGQWQRDKVLFAHEIIAILESEFGPLRPVLQTAEGMISGNPLTIIGNSTTHAPAQDYEFADGRGRIGLIASVSQPFCASCNRFRVTADGKFRNCLFSHEETDVKTMLRSGGTDDEIALLMLECIAAKNEGHEINSAEFIQPDRPMHSIGG